MSVEREMSARLEFDLADRMRRALRISGVTVQDVADYLGSSVVEDNGAPKMYCVFRRR